ncbi:reverse transcriptase domain-containing protein, partial [Tanacetum coccineum]
SQVGGQGTEVNDGVDGVLDFSIIIAQQLQNLLPTVLAQVGNQVSNLRNSKNQNGDAVNDNIRGDVTNVIENDDLYTRWIEKMEPVQDKSRCSDNQKVKYTTTSTGSFVVNEMQKLETEFWNHAMVGAGHAAYTDRCHELARLMVIATEPTTIQKAMQKARTLTDEAIRNGSLKKNPEKRGNNKESSRDRNVRDDNKRTRTRNAFTITTNPECRVAPRMVLLVNARNLTATLEACYECGGIDHLKAACRRLNQTHRLGGNRPNQVVVNNGGQGRRNNSNQACRRAFMLGAEEARQDPNIVTGTFTLNNHCATTLFDCGVDYSFVSTTFIPLLGIEPNDLRFSYEIEIASGQLVEIDKAIKGCKLEIEGHMFDINLIPFGSESFDVIICMDWLSNHKAEIICHEKVDRIPLPDDKVLRVIGERLEEKMRHVMSAKAKEQKQEEIVVVRDFPEVFLNDLSGLPP